MTRSATRIILYIFFVLLAVVPESLTVDGKNYLLISFALLMIPLLVLVHYNSFPSMRNDWMLIMLTYFLIVSVANHETAQPLSLAYSFFFIGTYVFYSSFAKATWTIENYRKVLRFLMILFLIGTLLGQLVVYLDLFAPLKQLSFGALHGGFHSILENGSYRFYSLSSEPSYAAFIVIALYYSYISTDTSNGSLFKGDNLFLFFLLAYMLVMFKSGYGIVLLGIIVMSYFGWNRNALMAYAFFFLGGIIFLALVPNFGPVYRIVNLVSDTDFMDLHSIRVVDFNVYVRVAPILHYFKSHPLTDIALYFGHGAGASKGFVVPEIYAAYKGDFLGGFMPAFFYDYGLIGVALVFIFIRSLVPALMSTEFIIFLLMLLNANINTQLFWFLTFCFTMNEFYRRTVTEYRQHALT